MMRSDDCSSGGVLRAYHGHRGKHLLEEVHSAVRVRFGLFNVYHHAFASTFGSNHVGDCSPRCNFDQMRRTTEIAARCLVRYSPEDDTQWFVTHTS